MMFVNATRYPAALPRSSLDQTRNCASLVARVTYDLVEGRLTPATEQPWKTSLVPADSPRGPREADGPFLKGGVDLYLFGHARSAHERPVRSIELTFGVGTSFVRRAIVHGNRHWRKQSRGVYEPSPATEITQLALTRAQAFGGTVRWDGLTVPWAQNPSGKGFWIDENAVEGVPLPNLEEPDRPMRSWLDRPPVCGLAFCPMENAERFLAGTDRDPETMQIRDVKSRYFNTAYPPMVAPRAEPGDEVVVGGVLHDGKLRFGLPRSPVELLLRFGEKRVKRTPVIDEIGVEVDEKRVFVTWRFGFKYEIRARERREATLVLREDFA